MPAPTDILRNTISILLAALGLSACGSGESAIRCYDDSVCPDPGICIVGGGCEIPQPATFCEENGDGVLCTDADNNEGECRSDQCVAFVCPDGVLDANEVCDGPVGPGSCTELGFDFGTPSCESCSGPGPERCGVLGWQKLGNKGLATVALYAAGGEVWLGGLDPRYFDGLNLLEDPSSPSFSAIDGSSRDNIWSFAFGLMYRFDGDTWTRGPDAVNLATQQAAIATVSVDEAYVAGRDSSDNSPTIWAYNSTADTWDVTHSLESGQSYTAMTHVGQTIFAANSTTISIKDASGWRDVSGVSGVRNLWARAADDVYVATENGVHHFDGAALTEISPIRQANVGGVGDLTYIVGVGEMFVHRSGAPFTEMRHLKAEGFIGDFGTGSRVIEVYSTSDRIVANYSNAIYRFNGTGFLDVNITGAAEDISATGNSVYWIREDNGRAIGVIDDAFSLSPTVSAFPVAVAIGKLWARGSNDVFAIGPGSFIVHWDGIDTTTVFDSGALSLRDIDGDETTAMAVGRSGNALLEGGVWQDIAMPSGIVELAGVYASGGEFVGVGVDGGIAVFRNGAWTTVDSKTTNDLLAVDGTSTSNFWAVGSAGTIVHCQDVGGSLNCEVEGPSSTLFFTDVAVASDSDVLATSKSSDPESAIHFDGLAWNPVNLGPVRAVVASGAVIWLGDDDAATGFMRRLDRIVSWDTASN